MTNLFEIGLGFNQETQTYAAIIRSVTDNKVATIEDQTLRVVTSRLSKLIRQKAKQVRAFPLPEPNRIISSQTEPVLLGPNGMRLNGRS